MADDYDLLRENTGMTVAALDDPAAAKAFADARSTYPSGSVGVVFAAARVQVLQSSWAKSVEEDVDYTQNEDTERLGQRAPNKEKLLLYWERKLSDALAAQAEGASNVPTAPPSGAVKLRATF